MVTNLTLRVTPPLILYIISNAFLGLKQIVILAFVYPLSFQMNSPNIPLNIRSSRIAVFFGKMMLISVD